MSKDREVRARHKGLSHPEVPSRDTFSRKPSRNSPTCLACLCSKQSKTMPPIPCRDALGTMNQVILPRHRHGRSHHCCYTFVTEKHRHREAKGPAQVTQLVQWFGEQSLTMQRSAKTRLCSATSNPQITPLSELKLHTNILGQCQALWVGDRSQLLLLQLLNGVLVVSEVQLGTHQDDGRAGAVVPYLGEPLEVGEWRVRGSSGEWDKDKDAQGTRKGGKSPLPPSGRVTRQSRI